MKLATSRIPTPAPAVKHNQIKTLSHLLALAGTVAMLAGCASTGRETAGSVDASRIQSGENGSFSQGNPFAVGAGGGYTHAN